MICMRYISTGQQLGETARAAAAKVGPHGGSYHFMVLFDQVAERGELLLSPFEVLCLA